jgi:hypothetical protein
LLQQDTSCFVCCNRILNLLTYNNS